MDKDKRTYIKVPYDEKDLAKQLGARWDKDEKKWYYTRGSDLHAIQKWLPEKIQYKIKYAEPDEDELPEAIAFEVAKEGLNGNSIRKISGHHGSVCINRDMNQDYKEHYTIRDCQRIFPEIDEKEIYRLYEKFCTGRRANW